jgi:hypothetical protein
MLKQKEESQKLLRDACQGHIDKVKSKETYFVKGGVGILFMM